MKFSFTHLPFYKGYSVLSETKKSRILSKENFLYKESKKNKDLEFIGKVNINLIDCLFIKNRYYQRLRRLIFYNCLQIKKNLFFVNFSKKIGLIKNKKFYEISNIKNKFKILNNAFCFDDNKNLIFGEYISNNNRNKDINIYKYDINKNKIYVIYKFKKGKIRHIHGVYRDPFTGYYYVLTGDEKNECGIFYTKNNFKKLINIGYGDESWRSVSLIFTKKYIYYAMDAEFIQNNIFSINKKTYERKKIRKISGPVYYSTLFMGYPLFVVTAELCPSQNDNKSKILLLKNDKIIKIKSFEKDLINYPLLKSLCTKLFLPGLFHLFKDSNQNIYFSGYSLKNADNEVFVLKN